MKDIKITYPLSNIVSVWIGNFSSEEEFDENVVKEIVPMLNLKKNISSLSEVTFEKDAVPVETLLKGFSGWETFNNEASVSARGFGIVSANSALVCYYVKCDEAPNTWGKMHFLGSFSGRDVT